MKNRLLQIIKEEVRKALKESYRPIEAENIIIENEGGDAVRITLSAERYDMKGETYDPIEVTKMIMLDEFLQSVEEIKSRSGFDK